MISMFLPTVSLMTQLHKGAWNQASMLLWITHVGTRRRLGARAGPSADSEGAGPSSAGPSTSPSAGPSTSSLAGPSSSLSAGPSTSLSAGPLADAGPSQERELEPYFAAGLAKSPEEPTVFNFELFLFDTLELPCGLFADGEAGPVSFRDVGECEEYCARFVAEMEERAKVVTLQPDESQEMRQHLDKVAIFHNTGKPLGERLKTGNELFDSNLEDLRLDNFGNVMFLLAPPWSDISVQFMHGYPRRLIEVCHRGPASRKYN